MNAKNIRTFFALKMPRITLGQIEKATFDLNKTIPDHIKWVSSESLHITLKFIGHFNTDHLGSIQEEIVKHLSDFGKLKIAFGRLGIFPNPNKPKIIWLGIKLNAQINYLVRILNSITVNLGYEGERRNFSPHLTIGRLRNYVPNEIRTQISRRILEHKLSQIDQIEINKLSFIKSDLKQQGPNYTLLFDTKFS